MGFLPIRFWLASQLAACAVRRFPAHPPYVGGIHLVPMRTGYDTPCCRSFKLSFESSRKPLILRFSAHALALLHPGRARSGLQRVQRRLVAIPVRANCLYPDLRCAFGGEDLTERFCCALVGAVR